MKTSSSVTSHITNQAFDRGHAPGTPRSILVGVLFALFAGLGAGCQSSIPPDALKLSPQSLEQRQQQTRKYVGSSETDILAASAGVLQDLGFNIDESETRLGVIVASKQRTARDNGQYIGRLLLGLTTGVFVTIDERQKIRVGLVTRPASDHDPTAHFVRVTIQRIIWNDDKQVARVEAVEKPEIYQEFFAKLSKSIYLEAKKI